MISALKSRLQGYSLCDLVQTASPVQRETKLALAAEKPAPPTPCACAAAAASAADQARHGPARCRPRAPTPAPRQGRRRQRSPPPPPAGWAGVRPPEDLDRPLCPASAAPGQRPVPGGHRRVPWLRSTTTEGSAQRGWPAETSPAFLPSDFLSI